MEHSKQRTHKIKNHSNTLGNSQKKPKEGRERINNQLRDSLWCSLGPIYC